uniref:Uncharacterized protein n=1 Tax=Anguilla anguilla TaxID=7936 RepID=A0A0E9QJR1_ANGAN
MSVLKTAVDHDPGSAILLKCRMMQLLSYNS